MDINLKNPNHVCGRAVVPLLEDTMASNMSGKTKARKRRSLVRNYGSVCAICGKHRPISELTLDHIIPRFAGGSNALWNLRLACYSCNYNRHH